MLPRVRSQGRTEEHTPQTHGIHFTGLSGPGERGAHLAGHEGLLDGALAHALPAQLVLQLGQLRAQVCYSANQPRQVASELSMQEQLP